jgi:hypothetical protein
MLCSPPPLPELMDSCSHCTRTTNSGLSFETKEKDDLGADAEVCRISTWLALWPSSANH